MLARRSPRGQSSDHWRAHLEVLQLDRRDQPAVTGLLTTPGLTIPSLAEPATLAAALTGGIDSASNLQLSAPGFPSQVPSIPFGVQSLQTALTGPTGIPATANPLVPGLSGPTGIFPGTALVNGASSSLVNQSFPVPEFGPPQSPLIVTNRDSGYAEPMAWPDTRANPPANVPSSKGTAFLDNGHQTASVGTDEQMDWTAAATGMIDLSNGPIEVDSADAADLYGVYVGTSDRWLSLSAMPHPAAAR